MNEFMVALFVMAVGLSAAGALTHLYQGIARTPAELSYAGRTYVASMARLAMSFVCGPYIMLQMGLTPPQGGRPNLGMVALAALVGFGWAFITGLLLVGAYIAVITA